MRRRVPFGRLAPLLFEVSALGAHCGGFAGLGSRELSLGPVSACALGPVDFASLGFFVALVVVCFVGGCCKYLDGSVCCCCNVVHARVFLICVFSLVTRCFRSWGFVGCVIICCFHVLHNLCHIWPCCTKSTPHHVTPLTLRHPSANADENISVRWRWWWRPL